MPGATDYPRATEPGEVLYRSRQKALLELLCFPDDPRHGSVTGWVYGCRCDRCRAAYREYETRRMNGRRDG